MRRDYLKWYSPSLGCDMELLVFGERGFPILVFPTSGGRFYEYEDRGMVGALAPKIDRGALQVICLDSVDQQSWYNGRVRPEDRLHRQNAFDAYLAQELAPFVCDRTSWPQMATTGCSFGGYHAINFGLRHPDIVTYAVSMSGAFDIPKRFLEDTTTTTRTCTARWTISRIWRTHGSWSASAGIIMRSWWAITTRSSIKT